MIDAVIRGRRPTWDSFYSYSEDEFYDRLCSVGADIIFLHASHRDLFQRIKLDPTFCDIPLVMIDSWDDYEFPKRRERIILRNGGILTHTAVTTLTVHDFPQVGTLLQ